MKVFQFFLSGTVTLKASNENEALEKLKDYTIEEFQECWGYELEVIEEESRTDTVH